MSIHRPSTPLRRVSRGSLSALAGSVGPGGAPTSSSISSSSSAHSTPLSFLEPALGDLSDETSILSSNLADLAQIHDALNDFNEGFGRFLYGLKVAAYCIEWGEAPQNENFERAKERSAAFARGGGFELQSLVTPPRMPLQPQPHELNNQHNLADQTYMTQDDDASFEAAAAATTTTTTTATTPNPVLKSALKKPSSANLRGGAGTKATPGSGVRGVKAKTLATATDASASTAPTKPKITVAQKKKREKYAEEIIDTLPLEYRGTDPAAKKVAMAVIMALIAAGPNGTRIADIVKTPELPQVKVNKCLIALTAAKQVTKQSNNGIVYALDTKKHPSLP